MVSFALMAVSGVVWIAFPVVLIPMQAELGWSRSELSLGFSIFALTNAGTAPFVGWAMARFDSRYVLSFLSVVLGAGLAGASQLNSQWDFWIWYGLIGGFGVNCFSSSSIFVLLAHEFPTRPASAMAFADAASGLAVFIGSPLLHLIISTSGWRSAFLILAIVAGGVGAASHLFLLNAIRRAAPGDTTVSQPAARARLRISLLILVISFLCGSAVLHGLQTQQVGLFIEWGVTEDVAIWVLAWTGLATFVWRIASGLLADRFGLVATAFLTMVGGGATFALLTLLALGSPALLLIVFPLVMSIGFGGQTVLLAAAARRLVPIFYFSVALGLMRIGAGLGMALGPITAAYFYDQTASYVPAIAIFGVIAVTHFVTLWLATTSSPAHVDGAPKQAI